MQTPTYSVVVTCYNYGHYLAGCLESVLRQTYQNFEIILVNDGSTDNTDEVIAPYIRDSRILYIKQPNAGQANAKNTGIRNANGGLIAFLDADDLWEETKLEKQISLFQDPHVGVAYSTVRYINEQGSEIPSMDESTYLTPQAGKVTEFLFFDNFIPFSSSVVRCECLDRVGAFDESLIMGIDWDLWLRISVHYLFRFVDEPLLLYRWGHADQMSKNLDLRHECADRIMARFLARNPGMIPDKIINDAMVYTYARRGYCYRSQNVMTSLKYYLKAIRTNPIHWGTWKGLIKTGLIASGVMRK